MYIKKKKKNNNLEKPRQTVLIFGANYKLWNEIPGIFYFLFFYFYFILFATLITKNIGKEEEKKKEVARRPNRNYRSL